MSTANMSDPNTMIAAPVHGTDGERLGKIACVYFDNETNQPAWAAVRTGIFGDHVALVPLGQGRWDGNALTVPYDKAALHDAPHHDPDAAITANDKAELYHHYGLSTAGRRTGRPAGADSPGDRTGGSASREARSPVGRPTKR